jgi:hypothetical protein
MAVGSLILPASAMSATVSIDFDTAADFDTNFVETAVPAAVSWNENGYLTRSNTSGLTGTVAMFYNSGATGGSSGSGGTTFSDTRDTFGGSEPFTISVDIRLSQVGASNSFGITVGVPTGQAKGYTVIWRLDNGSSASDVRFYDPNDFFNVGNGGVSGTPSSSGTISTALSANTWYTAQLTVEEVDGNMKLSASLFNQGGSQIGSTVTYTDTTSPLLGGGQVGFRLGAATNSSSFTMDIDNFSITPIPEPSAAFLTLLASGLTMAGRRRRY